MADGCKSSDLKTTHRRSDWPRPAWPPTFPNQSRRANRRSGNGWYEAIRREARAARERLVVEKGQLSSVRHTHTENWAWKIASGSRQPVSRVK
jgi:hypothetical protein